MQQPNFTFCYCLLVATAVLSALPALTQERDAALEEVTVTAQRTACARWPRSSVPV